MVLTNPEVVQIRRRRARTSTAVTDSCVQLEATSGRSSVAERELPKLPLGDVAHGRGARSGTRCGMGVQNATALCTGVPPDVRSQPYRISPGISEPRNDLGFQTHSREARASAATVWRAN
jgi:hypothetical protein